MDKNRFDGFTRQLAQRENRRQAIKTLLAGGAGTAAALMIGKEVTEAAKPPSTLVDCCPASAPRLCGTPGTCTAVATDPNNCGGCGVTCQSGQTCVDGVCSPPPVQCRKLADCASSNTDCQTATACRRGVCVYSYAVIGTRIANQTQGDCQVQICDVVGNIITVPDSTDTPEDQGECSIGICYGVTPGQQHKNPGDPCSLGVCDSHGNCVECNTGSDCLHLQENECQKAVCTSGACEFDNAGLLGISTDQQTPGDCLQNVCDGNGGITTQPANDPPAGVDICLPSYTCDNGTAVPNYASTTTVCGNGGYCDGTGNCVACNINDQCLPGPGTSLPVCNADHTCGYTCAPGYVGCPGGPDCATNITSDINNCGGCGQICNPANATGTCNAGQCVITSCNPGFANCDGNQPNGCEVNLMTDFNNCGTCGNACRFTNASAVCNNGACAIGTCNPGWAHCDLEGPAGCETPLGTNANCGSCGDQCPSGTNCTSGVCQ